MIIPTDEPTTTEREEHAMITMEWIKLITTILASAGAGYILSAIRNIPDDTEEV